VHIKYLNAYISVLASILTNRP